MDTTHQIIICVTDILLEMKILLHCFHEFLVVHHFSEVHLSDVLLNLNMAVQVHNSVDTEINENKDKMFYLVVQVTHAHLGHLGHQCPLLDTDHKLLQVSFLHDEISLNNNHLLFHCFVLEKTSCCKCSEDCQNMAFFQVHLQAIPQPRSTFF